MVLQVGVAPNRIDVITSCEDLEFEAAWARRVPSAAAWGTDLAERGGWQSGAGVRFQVWYSDPASSPCGSRFDFSNGVEVGFGP